MVEAPAPPALLLEAFGFRYAEADPPVLEAVSAVVPAGQRIAIMGATGVGKTTLCMALNGLVPQFHQGKIAGRVLTAGLDTQRFRIQTLVRHIGYVMQDPEAQIFGRTVEEDVAFGPANLGRSRAEIEQAIRASLTVVGLDGFRERSTDQLSGGEKQRLAIADILAMAPETIVLDEPTAELDPAGTEEIFAAIRRIGEERGITTLLVTHEPEHVASWAERLIVLADGRVAYDGDPRTAFRNVPAMRRWRVRPPQVAEVGWALHERGLLDAASVPVTVEEAIEVFRPRLAAKLALATRDERRAGAPDSTARGTGPAVIEARGLRHTYGGGREALVGVDVRIERNEFVAVVGRNGAGKTTFAKHLNGLLRATAGEVLVEGRPVAHREIADLARSVGYVFQNPDHQIFAQTVEEEVAYGLRNIGLGGDELERRVTAALETVGMVDLRTRHPFSLGKGQRQALAVASVLALEPPVLVVDEPTTGLDWVGSNRMLDLLRDLHRRGHTIVVVTHDMGLVARHAERVLVFAGGRIIADGSPADVFGRPEILRRGALRPPQVVTLAAELGGVGDRPILTVEEMTEALASRWRREAAS